MKSAEQPQVHSNAGSLGDGRLSAPSALRNRDAIIHALSPYATKGKALEIASGTGEHVVEFAKAFPRVIWQPSDVAPERVASIKAWAKHAAKQGAKHGVQNQLDPLLLDACSSDWDVGRFDLVIVSNIFHLIHASAGKHLFQGVARCLNPGGVLFVYGPFRQGEDFRSQGDVDFHTCITQEDPKAGYKSVEWMAQRAQNCGLKHHSRIEMPANNLSLVWRKPL